MDRETQQRWRDLCAAAEDEKDIDKFRTLLDEIQAILKGEEARLRAALGGESNSPRSDAHES